jgi:hypothetical protein
LRVLPQAIHLEHESSGIYTSQTPFGVDQQEALGVRDGCDAIGGVASEANEVGFASKSVYVGARHELVHLGVVAERRKVITTALPSSFTETPSSESALYIDGTSLDVVSPLVVSPGEVAADPPQASTFAATGRR